MFQSPESENPASSALLNLKSLTYPEVIWAVVKIMVPFGSLLEYGT